MKKNITLQAAQYEQNGYGKHNYVRFTIDAQDQVTVNFHKSRKAAENAAENDGSWRAAQIMTIKQAVAEYPEYFC